MKIREFIKTTINEYLNEEQEVKNWKQFLNENELLSNYNIKSSSDDVYAVGEANGLTIKNIKETIPIKYINGGVRLSNPQERKRINNLKNEILKNKFISRIIVDSDNNIIEGQHRYTAMVELGFDLIPVVKLFGIDDYINSELIHKLIDKYKIHPDYKHQIVNMVAEIIADENGNYLELKNYEPPKGFENMWNDIINFVINNPK